MEKNDKRQQASFRNLLSKCPLKDAKAFTLPDDEVGAWI